MGLDAVRSRRAGSEGDMVFSQDPTPASESVQPEQTPTAEPQATPTPQATPEPSPTPEESVENTTPPFPSGAPWLELSLASGADYLVAGEVITLNLDASTIPSNANIRIQVPPGLQPAAENSGVFDSQNHILELPVQAAGAVPWLVAEDALGPFVFSARAFAGETILAEGWLVLDQAVRGRAGPQGGSVAWPARGIEVHFPAGALEEEVALLIRQTATGGIAPYNLSGNSVVLQAETLSGKRLREFEKPVTLQFSYDETRFVGNEYSLFIHYYDEETGLWTPVPTRRDVENNRLTTQSDHFSEWDLSAASWESARLPSLKNFQTDHFTGAATYSLPLDVPPGPGGFQPDLSLSYNSASVDGANLMTQAGWAGMGWSMDVGAILRDQHGTSDSLIDDTFSLMVNSAGGLMVPEAHDPGDNVIRYYLLSENFWRIQYHRDIDVWVAWDKVGTKYVFGGYYNSSDTLVNDENSGAFYPTGCDGSQAVHATWQWGLRQIVNKFNQKIDITWERDYRTLEDYCGAGHDAWVVLDNNPSQISYPTGGYRILFQTQSDRNDYAPGWHVAENVFYTKKRLDAVLVQQNDNGAWVNAWRYDLTFAQDETSPQYVFPNYSWSGHGGDDRLKHVLTLSAVVKEFWDPAVSAWVAEPEMTFAYDDGMHLTAAENGQGGRIEYTYDIWHETINTLGSRAGVSGSIDDLCHNQGAYGTFGWSKSCASYDGDWFMWIRDTASPATLTLPHGLTRPGSYYRLDLIVSIYGHGDSSDWFKVGLGADGTSAQYHLTGSFYNQYTYAFYPRSSALDGDYRAMGRIISSPAEYCNEAWCQGQNLIWDGIAVHKATLQPVITRYRVIEKEIIDQFSGDTLSYTFTYDEPATNDSLHSAVVENSPNRCGQDTSDPEDEDWECYTPIYQQFRGHAASTVTHPSGLTTVNFYHQDDIYKGQSPASMTLSAVRGDNFESGWDSGQWIKDLKSAGDYADVIRHRGDGAMRLHEAQPTEWSYIHGNSVIPQDGRSMIVQFKATAGSDYSVGVMDENNLYYRWTITGRDDGLHAAYGDGSGFTIFDTLISPSDGYETDAWYVAVFTLDHDNGYSTRVWKRDDPAISGYAVRSAASCNFNASLDWRFMGANNDGTIWFDEYFEGYLFDLRFTDYDHETNPNGISLDPPNYHQYSQPAFPGFDVHWVFPDDRESYQFERESTFQATSEEYWYEIRYQGDYQYGNVTRIFKRYWDGNAWEDEQMTWNRSFPADTASLYLVGLNASTYVWDCVGGVCDWDKEDLVQLTQMVFDNNASVGEAPTQGIPSWKRDFKSWNGSTFNISDTKMTYDSWGNQTSITQYPTYRSGAPYDGSDGQTTTTTYDATYHTYPVSVTPPIASHQSTMTYDTRLGLPQTMTDPNDLVTRLCYDSRGRVTGLARGDSGAPPTCSSTMNLSISYHEAVESGGSWTPFWTEATQLLDERSGDDLVMTLRKFYDGIGRQIQTQMVGVNLDGQTDGARTIVTDIFYNPNGQPEWASMPYHVANPAAYHSPPACTTGTCTRTLYDVLGRVIETHAPGGAVVQTLYGFDAAEGLRTVQVTDPNQNATTSYLDVWGQTVRVAPAAGPWLEYTYDGGGRLVQVDQVNGSGVFASTYLAYDLGGRKVEMNDPDMGVWTYQYDAMDNLTTQVDSKNQQVHLCYDDLNRLTGKYFGGSGSCSTPSGWDVTYHYDAYTAAMFSGYTGPTAYGIGRRTGMDDASGQTIWSYDQQGSPIREDKTIGTETFTTQWAYTEGDLLSQMVYPAVSGAAESLYYDYHPQGTMASVGSLFSTHITLSYDEAGRAANRTYYTSGSGLQTHYTYYAWNATVNNEPQGGRLRTAQTGTTADPDSLLSFEYRYDANGNVLSIEDLLYAPAQVQSFSYDALDRLTAASANGGFGSAYSDSYGYDSRGRMSSMDGAALNYGATRSGTCQAASLTPAAPTGIAHAVASKSGGKTYSYDCNGNMIGRGNQTLIYDAENRLVEVQENSVTMAEYTYDGDGNRVKSVVYGTGEIVTTYYVGMYYEKIVTVDGGGTTTAWKKYYYAGASRLAMREDTDNPLYLMGDHLGSTSLVVNTSGAQVARRSYLPFGSEWAASGTVPTDFGFTGQREAGEIGLYYYVARWLDPEIAHFAQADTIVPGAGNPAAYNRYGYVDYNPVNFSDPTGHKKRPTKADGDNPYDVTEFLALDLVATANSQENQDLEALWNASENTSNPYPHIGYVVSSQVAAVFGVNARFGSGKMKDIKLEIYNQFEKKGVTLCSTEGCAWVDYSTPGNIVFGYSMAQIGIDALIYETAGGFLEMWDTRGGLRDGYDFAWWFEGSMGDNPDDYAAVQFGIYLFMTYGTDLTYTDLQEALVYWVGRFQPPPDDFDEPFLARPGDNDYGAGYFDYYAE